MSNYKKAIKYHKDGDITNAIKFYNLSYNEGDRFPILYQNFGALLRSQGDFDNAEKVYKKGLKLYPNNLSILLNLGNLYQDHKPASAILCYSQLVKNKAKLDAFDLEFQRAATSLISTLKSQGLTNAAANFTRNLIILVGPKPAFLVQLVQVVDSFNYESSNISKESFTNSIYGYLDTVSSSLDLEDCLELSISLASLKANSGFLEEALELYKKGLKFVDPSDNLRGDGFSLSAKSIALLDVLNWNYANLALRCKDLSKGWTLFDYGLRVPATGRQRWQRALFKPFSSNVLPLWNGQPLADKRLLILEEQAVGDVMMFMTIIGNLLQELDSGHISVCLNSRLYPIYKRSYDSDIESGRLRIFQPNDFLIDPKLSASDFDYQIPLGSIPQFRLNDADKVQLNLNNQRRLSVCSDLRTSLSQRINASPNQMVLGISWRGGAGKDRVNEKSVDFDLFTSLLQAFPDIKFLNLQYGDCSSVIAKWQQLGIDVASFTDINPLTNMDDWLCLVDCCDSVLSVANTTIHGAASLRKSTMCLLSKKPDWRWVDDRSITRSYWYPTVSVARQCMNGSWKSAINLASSWISEGCRLPSGPVF